MSFPVLKNDRLIRALLRQPTDTTPVWIMRQAGRYLPEYRETRKSAGGFLDLCKNKELACEVTVTAAEKLEVDAAIIFADILLITEPMGFSLEFVKGGGPVIHNPFRGKEDLLRLEDPQPAQSLDFVTKALRLTRDALPSHIPLIGFSGAPFTFLPNPYRSVFSLAARRV